MASAENGWSTDYDGWFGQELKSKIRYFKPTCIIPESPAPEKCEDKELDADLKKKLTDIFTLHGSIQIYNPSTQKSYSDELAEDSDLSAAEVYLQINQFKAYTHELEKDVRKRIKENPQKQAGSLAIDLQEDVEVVKTVMANIASRQQFDKQQLQGKLEKRLLSEEPPESAESETPIQFEIDELDITLKVQKLNGKIYDYIFIKDMSDLPEPLMVELTEFVKSHLEKK